MINLNHIYYGNIRIWVELSDSKLAEISYIDNGYLLETKDISIILQIP